MKRLLAVALLLVCATPALARHHSRHHEIASRNIITCDRFGCHGELKVTIHIERPHEAIRHKVYAQGSDPRPHAWCGWWLRQQLGVADRSFNLARNWLHFGSPAPRDCIHCIAVWPHHVGLVTGRPGPGQIILKSGNDGHAVRERERSSRGIIGYRWPSNHWASL